ncbi:hypothetical protein I3843_08G035500 [Carya illinoinensis]|nr:hypothetical protein I3843_08G035500 [Carya illinoinensis]
MKTGGKSYVSSPPAFSNDGKRLLVCTGNTVSIFSTSTGLQIASLEGHTAPVTSVIVVPASSPASKILCCCWTASLDGSIRHWDFSVPDLMKKVDIKMPIFSMTPTPEFVAVSSVGKFIGIRNKRKLHIWMVPEKDSGRSVSKKIALHHTKNLTVLAFHPSKRIVAAGDVTGRILVWRGFGYQTFSVSDELVSGRLVDKEEERPGVRGNDDADSCSTWHWHSAEVNVLFFSSDGAYLYSGGKEGVLVVWQLDTGKKKFLPRIGSPLLYYTDSPDPTLSSISCADNQIHILKMPSMEILNSISGIKLPHSLPGIYEGLYSGFAFDYSSGLVALCTENYGIQFYSLFNDRGIYEVQVCERNHQPADEITVVVTFVALSQDGSMMSTVEAKLPEEGIGGLVCLKFWALGSENKKFSLSTVIYEPHRDAGISAVAFHPTRNVAVSSSYGGDFKLWVCNDEIQEKGLMLQNSGWACLAVGAYKKKPMTAAAFSCDGSVLAVAAETVITLWDPNKNVLVAVIGETLTSILFPCPEVQSRSSLYGACQSCRYLGHTSFTLKL